MKPLHYEKRDYAAYGILVAYLAVGVAFRVAGLSAKSCRYSDMERSRRCILHSRTVTGIRQAFCRTVCLFWDRKYCRDVCIRREYIL